MTLIHIYNGNGTLPNPRRRDNLFGTMVAMTSDYFIGDGEPGRFVDGQANGRTASKNGIEYDKECVFSGSNEVWYYDGDEAKREKCVWLKLYFAVRNGRGYLSSVSMDSPSMDANFHRFGAEFAGYIFATQSEAEDLFGRNALNRDRDRLIELLQKEALACHNFLNSVDFNVMRV